jgi:hypothetical protein
MLRIDVLQQCAVLQRPSYGSLRTKEPDIDDL